MTANKKMAATSEEAAKHHNRQSIDYHVAHKKSRPDVKFFPALRLDLIALDAGIQQRPLDDDVVRRYTALMQDKVEFPPVEIIRDSTDYFLWDGFHRVECAKKLGRKTIAAHVERGSKRDTLWLSFSANKSHGFPRQPGIAKKIIERILTDKSWSKKSLSGIARHVGVTRQYIEKIKAELSAHGATSLHDSEGAKPHFQAKNGEKGATWLHPFRDEQVEVQSSRGRTYTQRSQEKEHRQQEPPKDAVGRIIPEHLRELYAGRKVIWTLVSDLARIRDSVNKHLDDRDPVFSLLNVTAFQAEYDNLRATLKGAMAHAVCVYCGGDAKDCMACHGLGLLNKSSYDFAPREMK